MQFSAEHRSTSNKNRVLLGNHKCWSQRKSPEIQSRSTQSLRCQAPNHGDGMGHLQGPNYDSFSSVKNLRKGPP